MTKLCEKPSEKRKQGQANFKNDETHTHQAQQSRALGTLGSVFSPSSPISQVSYLCIMNNEQQNQRSTEGKLKTG